YGLSGILYSYSFFFQAEDGIRDGHVTGVQTCALPISDRRDDRSRPDGGARLLRPEELPPRRHGGAGEAQAAPQEGAGWRDVGSRSEERRVGKEWRARGRGES